MRRPPPGTMLVLLGGALAGGGARSVAASQALGPVLVVRPVAVGANVSPKLASKAGQLFEVELEKLGFSPLGDQTLEQIRSGSTAVDAPDLSRAQSALEAGKNHYLNFELEKAVAELERARDAYEGALAQTGEIGPLAETLMYLGACYLSLDDAAAANRSFLALLRRRPGYSPDAQVHPPQIVEAFDAARLEARSAPSGPVTVASAPPLASVTLDGVRRGETPVTVKGLIAGEHALRVESAGHHPWWKIIDVTPEGVELTVHLRAATSGDDLAALEAEAAGQGDRARMIQQARSLARGAKVSAVAVLALTRTGEDYAVAAALVRGDGSVQVAWTVIDRDFLRAQQALRALAGRLIRATEPVFVDAGSPEPEIELDFDGRLLGFLAATTPGEPLPGPDEEPDGSVFGTWWFWTGVALLAGGVAAGAWYAQPVTVVQEPNTVTIDLDLP